MQDQVFTSTMPLPDYVKVEEGNVTALILTETEDGVTLSDDLRIDIQDLLATNKFKEDVAAVSKELTQKRTEQSNQSQNEINHTTISEGSFEYRIQPMPYDPECFANFLIISDVHAACVRKKVDASVGRKYLIKPQYPVQTDAGEEAADVFIISPKEYKNDLSKIQNFIKNCNQDKAFEDIVKMVGMDRQGIGWGAFEVVREASGKIARLYRVPATRLRVLEGFDGFVEVVGFSKEQKNKPIYQYYQRFGDKVVVEAPDPFDFTDKGKTIRRPYNPEEDGELQIGGKGGKIVWNLYSKTTGEPINARGISAFKDSATEILYLPNDHVNTVYYGLADGSAAVSAILGNVYIRDYVHQFFEYNCVPRWAIIIRGAKVDKELRKTLEDYFQTHVKGKSHQTLLLTLGGPLQNVHVEFKQLDVGNKEADFMKTTEMHNQQIMTANGVPASMIGIGEKTSTGSRGLGPAEIFKDYEVTPLQQYFARKLNLLFRLGLGVINAKLEYMELDVRDSLTKAQILQILDSIGYTNINEGRDEYGMAAIKGGDVHYVRIKDGAAIRVQDLDKLEYSHESENQTSDTVGIGSNLENNLNNSAIAQDTRLN